MVMALGVGAWTAGVFHLFTHAFFKACLFLCAGSVSHACHHTFDMREMGGLHKHMKTTHICFVVSGFALAGIFPFAGFFSKDEILVGAYQGQGGNPYYAMLGMGLVTAFMTAAYMGRAYWLTFRGEYRGHGHPHESPRAMTVPLVILAVLSAAVGFLNFPIGPSNIAHRFEHYVQPTFLFPPDLVVAKFNPVIAGVSIALALLGGAIGMLYYARGEALKGLTSRNAAAAVGYRVLENRFGLDWAYDNLGLWIRGPLGMAMYWFNQTIIDGIVNGVGWVSRAVGRLTYRYVDQDVVDRIVNGSGTVSEGGGQFLRRLQSGKVQEYAALLFGGAVVLALIFFFTI
jgi:NADH-quinone oxidoreductase subunit L